MFKIIQYYLLILFLFNYNLFANKIEKFNYIRQCNIIDSLAKYNDSICKLEIDRLGYQIQLVNSNNIKSAYYRRLGLFYYRQENFLNSINSHKQASKYSKKLNSKWALASDYCNIGDVYFTMKEYNKALELYQSAFELYNTGTNLYFLEGYIKFALAKTYLKKENYFLALSFSNSGLELLIRNDNNNKKINSEKFRAEYLIKNHLLLGKINDNLNNLPQMKIHLDSTYRLINKFQYSNYLLEYHLLLETYNLKQNGNINDKSNLVSNIKKVKKKKLYTVCVDYYNLLKDEAKTLGNFQHAIQFSDSIELYKEKIFNVDKARAISHSQAKFETQKAEFEREKALNENSKLIIENLEKERRVKIYLFTILIISLILTLLLFIYRSKQKESKSRIKIKDLKISSLLHKNELENLNGILEGQEKERDRIAQDLHDSVGGMLASVKMHFNAIVSNNNFSNDYEENLFNKANTLLDESCTEVRRVAHDLHTAMQKQGGLKTQLINLKNAVKISNKMEISVFYDVDEHLLPSVIEKQLYKITLELMSNTLKHAKATKVNLQIIGHEKEIDFIFEDNGIGFKVEGIERGLGLTSIEKRVKKMGGILQIDSHEKSGSTFIISINLPEL